MAQKKRLRADEISAVWFAPEALRVERVQQAVKDGASAQEVADLASSGSDGEYREYLGDEIVEGVVTPQYGERLSWIHPQGEDEGWFERHTGDDEDYVPVQTPEEA